MSVLIIVSILFIIIWYCIYETEGFDDQPVDPKIKEKYQKFVGFYNPFLVDWEKAIVTSIGLDTPVKPLTNPSDISSATFKAPTRLEMNNYIKQFEKNINKPLPIITDPLPTTLTSTVVSDITNNISMDPTPYQNALQIMVTSQEEAQNQLNDMKKSPEGFDPINPYQYTEGFDSCADYKKCMTDPDVIDAVSKAQSEQQAKKERERQNQFESKLDKFNEIIFDAKRPDGTPRKLLDITKATSYGWAPKIQLVEGLQMTYNWFTEAYEKKEIRGY